MVDVWRFVAKWWIDMDSSSISNLSEWLNSLDAVNLQQVMSLIPSQIVKLNFNNSNTLNSSIINPITTINTTPLIISNLTDFTISNSWVTINVAWRYEIYTNLYIETTNWNRVMPSVQFIINWVTTDESGWLAYARNAWNNNTTGNFLISVYDINSGDTIEVATKQVWSGWVANLIGIKSNFILKRIW